MVNKKSSFSLFLQNYFVVISCFFYLNTNAQNQFGLTTGNYAGLHSLQMNPANICYQPVTYEFNILGVDVFLNNNDFFSNPTFVPTLGIKNNFNRIRFENHKYTPDSFRPGNLLVKSSFQSNGYVYGGANILGPSFLFAISRKTSLAITSAFRSQLCANNISTIAAKSLFDGLEYYPIRNQQLKMENTKVSFGSWTEIGFSYAHVVEDNYHYIHRFGFSLKALFGLAGGYIYEKGYNGWNDNGTNLIFDSSDFSYAYSGPSTNKNYKNNSNNSFLNGMGASIDIGYSVQKNAAAGTRYCPNFYHYGNNSKMYNWKLGISLLDIGAIQYYNNSFATNIVNGSLNWNKFDTISAYDITVMDATLRSYVGEEKTQTFKQFWLILPGAISLQYDYNLNAVFFVNATIIQRITLAKMPSLTRMNSIAIIPHYEIEKLTVSMPFILNEYKDFNLGLAIRYKQVTIGSDRFGETFGLMNLYGANFYFAYKCSLINRKIGSGKLF
jgi:hypothetical protein